MNIIFNQLVEQEVTIASDSSTPLISVTFNLKYIPSFYQRNGNGLGGISQFYKGRNVIPRRMKRFMYGHGGSFLGGSHNIYPKGYNARLCHSNFFTGNYEP